MNLDQLLGLLPNATRENGQYRASCPTNFHKNGDKSRGLYIAEGSKGQILLNCFAGCTAEDIVSTLGLNMSDLYTDTPERVNALQPSLRDLWEASQNELRVVHCALGWIEDAKELSEEDLPRLKLAIKRIRGYSCL